MFLILAKNFHITINIWLHPPPPSQETEHMGEWGSEGDGDNICDRDNELD